MDQRIKCALCGYVFNQEKAASSCKCCPMTKGCKLIKCPHCGYETPKEPNWFKKWLTRKKKNGTDGQS